MLRFIALLFFIFLSTFLKSQTVKVYIISAGVTVNVLDDYETAFGVGNVNITKGGTLPDYSNYDVLIINAWKTGFNQTDVDAVVNFVQNGGHASLSTEGAGVVGGGRFMSNVWNRITGQSITETGAGASGTNAPPRFHNSSGPWSLSVGTTLSGGTGSYASFANLHYSNVTHQRSLTPPSCGNIQASSAAYPSRPKLGDGTLYIQGEIQFPYSNLTQSRKVDEHAYAIAYMHYILLTNNQKALDSLNTWQANYVVDTNFAGSDTLLCEGSLSSLTLTIDSTYASYAWEDTEGNVLSKDSFLNINDTGVYIIKTVGIFPNCDGIDTIKVLYDELDFNFQTTSTCANTSEGILNVNNVSSTYLAAPITYQVDNNMPVNINTINGLTAGNHTIRVSDARGCLDSANFIIDTFPVPKASFTFDTVCLGDSTFFIDQSSISSGVISSWTWLMEGMNYTNPSLKHSFSTIGSHNTQLKLVSDNGCLDSITKSVDIHSNPIVDFVANATCQYENLRFLNNTTVGGINYNNNYIFSWQFGDGNTSNNAEPTHAYSIADTFDVMLTATTDNGCTDDTILPVIIYPKPIANFLVDSVCMGVSTSFTDQSTVSSGNIATWQWNIDNNTFASQNNSYTYKNDGIYIATLDIVSDQGCKDTISKQVVVHPLPVASFISSKTEIEVLKNTVEFYNESEGAVNYYWSFDTVETSLLYEPTFAYEIDVPCRTFRNKLIAETEYGCLDSSFNTITARGNLLFFMPNAFTPDGDGVNDEFKPVYTDLATENYAFQIYNRWGALIFETTDISQGWDGTDNGEMLPQGVYIWQIRGKTECEIDRNNFRGHITLLR